MGSCKLRQSRTVSSSWVWHPGRPLPWMLAAAMANRARKTIAKTVGKDVELVSLRKFYGSLAGPYPSCFCCFGAIFYNTASRLNLPLTGGPFYSRRFRTGHPLMVIVSCVRRSINFKLFSLSPNFLLSTNEFLSFTYLNLEYSRYINNTRRSSRGGSNSSIIACGLIQ